MYKFFAAVGTQLRIMQGLSQADYDAEMLRYGIEVEETGFFPVALRDSVEKAICSNSVLMVSLK